MRCKFGCTLYALSAHHIDDFCCLIHSQITTKLALGATIGIACADLSNSRYVYLIASSKIVHVDRRRRAIVEAALCFGIPIIWMVLHVVTQGHRFDIIEGFGCQVTVYFTWLAIIVVHLPLATSVVAAVYCGE